MSFGKRLAEARKKKGLSQDDVAKKLDTKAPVISRYERDEAKPSIEAAAKLSELLDVSLDYLVGHTDVQLDKVTFERIVQVSSFPEEDRQNIFSVIDAFIAKRKIQSIL